MLKTTRPPSTEDLLNLETTMGELLVHSTIKNLNEKKSRSLILDSNQVGG
jgi:hypothetical protein